MALPHIFLAVFATTLALGSPDWTDCPAPCRCKWTSGKKTAQCSDAGFSGIPDGLDQEMQVLNLSGNHIPTLGQDAFRSSGLINLQRIFLRSARVARVHRDAFRELIILVEVDLSDNEITHLERETFHGNERLRVLCLSGNPLGTLVAEQFPPLAYLRTLELEACLLEYVDRNAFIHLTALESLNLKSNKLHNLSERAFMNLPHLKALALDGNPWSCDCELRGFRNWFLSSNLHSMALFCSEPEWLSGQEWRDVPAEDFACPPQVFLSTNSQVQAEAGGNVSFGCHVIGDPEPTVTWLYDGRPIINHTWLIVVAEEGLLDKWANISVINVSEVDAGVYTCAARNSLDAVTRNVSLVLPEVVTATTLSKSDPGLVWWGLVCVAAAVAFSLTCTVTAVCCVRSKNRRRRRRMKASVSFTDQEKKLLDVSIATTTDRGTGSSEALGPDLEMLEQQQPPVHITIESEPMPLAIYPPPPPEFSTSALPAGAFGNIFISVSVSRDPAASSSSSTSAALVDASRCPDLLDLPHRVSKQGAVYHHHAMATLPRRPLRSAPQYDNMGPRVTAGGSSTLSLPGSTGELSAPAGVVVPPPSPTGGAVAGTALNPEFVSL